MKRKTWADAIMEMKATVESEDFDRDGWDGPQWYGIIDAAEPFMNRKGVIGEFLLFLRDEQLCENFDFVTPVLNCITTKSRFEEEFATVVAALWEGCPCIVEEGLRVFEGNRRRKDKFDKCVSEQPPATRRKIARIITACRNEDSQ